MPAMDGFPGWTKLSGSDHSSLGLGMRALGPWWMAVFFLWNMVEKCRTYMKIWHGSVTNVDINWIFSDLLDFQSWSEVAPRFFNGFRQGQHFNARAYGVSKLHDKIPKDHIRLAMMEFQYRSSDQILQRWSELINLLWCPRVSTWLAWTSTINAGL